jgi:hypothetical protein
MRAMWSISWNWFDIRTVIKNQDGSITITSKTDVVTVIWKQLMILLLLIKTTQYTILQCTAWENRESSYQLHQAESYHKYKRNGAGSCKQILLADERCFHKVMTENMLWYTYPHKMVNQEKATNQFLKRVTERSLLKPFLMKWLHRCYSHGR